MLVTIQYAFVTGSSFKHVFFVLSIRPPKCQQNTKAMERVTSRGGTRASNHFAIFIHDTWKFTSCLSKYMKNNPVAHPCWWLLWWVWLCVCVVVVVLLCCCVLCVVVFVVVFAFLLVWLQLDSKTRRPEKERRVSACCMATLCQAESTRQTAQSTLDSERVFLLHVCP